MNTLAYAYLGDAVYELYIRKHLIKKGIYKVNDLNKASLAYVSAVSQKKHLERLLQDNVLTLEEIEIYKRGRNAHCISKPKSTDIVTYKIATGLETLIGFLYIEEKYQRLDNILNYIVKES